jgi:PST family polysaccharide transporter
MNIAKASLINFYSHSIRIICALGVIKIIAAQTGPAGVAMMGQIANAINLFLPYTNAGIGNGVVKYIAEYNATNQVNETSKVINTSLSITLVASTVIAIGLYTFKNSLSVLLFGRVDYSWVFILFAFCIPFMALAYSLMYILNGYKRIKEYVTITAINALAFVALSFFFTFPYGISGALISVIASQTFLLIVILLFLVAARKPPLRLPRFNFDPKVLHDLSRFACMGLVSASLAPLSQIAIRTYIIDHLSIENAGYWQAVWRLSETYLSMITLPLSIYYLPRLAEIHDYYLLKQEIMNTLLFSVSLTVAISLIIFGLKNWIFTTFLSASFIPATKLLPFQLVGDVIKVAAWTIGMVMWAKSMMRLFIITEFFFSASFIVISLIFLNNFGLVGIAYGYALNYTLYLIFLIAYFRRNLRTLVRQAS